MKYDPARPVDAERWAKIDEYERLAAVEAYHRRLGVRNPSDKMHASIHVVVENQIAMGDSFPAERVLKRLMAEGLTRHEAVHAIGTVVASTLYSALRDKPEPSQMNAAYLEKLEALTAEKWRQMAEPEDR
jgi:hypothetical protein